MIGFGQTFVRLPAATALIAGAALLAGSATRAAPPIVGDEVALAVPRIAPLSGGAVALPRPLDPEQAARIRRIIALQRSRATAEAAAQDRFLEAGSWLDQAMLGAVLADRYLRGTPSARAAVQPEMLQAWLARWSDLPQAAAITAALAQRLPHPPSTVSQPAPAAAASGILTRNPDLDRSLRAAARSGKVAVVRRLLAHTKGLSPLYGSQLAGEAAHILFTLNHDADALSLVADWTERCAPSCAATASFAGGLAAWRLGHYREADALFTAAWHGRLTSPKLRAAAAFWAARAVLASGLVDGARLWLQRAAAEDATFYGLLARRRLQLASGRARAVLGEADVEAVAAMPGGARAFALLQVGLDDAAADELRLVWSAARTTPFLSRAVVLVTREAGFSDLAEQMDAALQSADGHLPDGALGSAADLIMPDLSPDGGFSIDPAMVYGLARAESGFDPRSTSGAGAIGILQIMPETASFLTSAPAQKGAAPATSRRLLQALRDPGRNLDLGQRYISYLSDDAVVRGDLLRLLASYNCGPARMADWSATLRAQGDPLLFLEAIPVDETRAYVPRVLTYMWLYARRLHLPAPSLDELAAGDWPRYHKLPHGEAPARLN